MATTRIPLPCFMHHLIRESFVCCSDCELYVQIYKLTFVLPNYHLLIISFRNDNARLGARRLKFRR